MRYIIPAFIAGFLSILRFASVDASTVRGRVRDVGGEALPWTWIRVSTGHDSTAAANALCGADGGFVIGGLEAGRYRIDVSRVTHRNVSLWVTIASDADTTLDLVLADVLIALDPVVVVAPRDAAPRLSEIVLDGGAAARIAGMSGDVLRAVAWQPGASSGGDFDARLSVRGAAPAETAYLVDGLPVPSAYHFGGVISIFHPDAVSRVRFDAGALDASGGPGTSGMVSLATRRYVETQRKIELTPIAAAGLWQQSLAGGNAGLTVAARGSYHDLALRALGRETGVTIPNFHDVNAALSWQIGPRDQIHLQLFRSADDMRMRASSTGAAQADNIVAMHSRLARAALGWDLERDLGANTRLGAAITAAYQPYEYDLRVSGDDADAMDFNAGAGMVRADVFVAIDRHRLRAGVTEIRQRMYYDVDIARGFWSTWSGPATEASAVSDPATLRERGSLDAGNRAAFIEAEWLPVARARFVAGGRMEAFHASSERFVDPHFRAEWNLGATMAGAAWAVQRAHPASAIGDPTVVGAGLRARRTEQFSANVERRVGATARLNFSMYRRVSTRALAETDPAAYASDTTERSWGTETSCCFAGRRWDAALGYGFGRSLQYNPDGALIRRAVGRGDGTYASQLVHAIPGWVASPFDPGHTIRAEVEYLASRSLRVGLRWQFRSGAPVTPIENVVTGADGRRVGNEGDPLSARLADYHRLDVRLELHPGGTSDWRFFLEVINAYNRGNLFRQNWDPSYSSRVRYESLPMIPALGVVRTF